MGPRTEWTWAYGYFAATLLSAGGVLLFTVFGTHSASYVESLIFVPVGVLLTAFGGYVLWDAERAYRRMRQRGY